MSRRPNGRNHDRPRNSATPTRAAFRISSLAILLLLVFACSKLHAQAGPPFQTDDPTPVDLHHYEFYVFSQFDGTPVEADPTGPAFEFNWGAVPNVQLHAILPFGAAIPSNNPTYSPSGTGPSAFGLTDMELGVKYNFIKQTPHRPAIGSFTMFEFPTGSYTKGLGVGKVWYKLPLWAEKELGSWSLVGGMGYTVVPQTGYRNYLYGGYLMKASPPRKPRLQPSSMPAATTISSSRACSCSLPMATPSPAKQKTTLTSASTKHGEETKTPTRSPQPMPCSRPALRL
jgi:hypothetical protein